MDQKANVPAVKSSSISTSVKARLGTLGELFSLLAESKRLWLIPLVSILLIVAVLLAAFVAVQYVAPFVYTVF